MCATSPPRSRVGDLPSESRPTPPRPRPPRPSPPRGLGSGGNSASLEAIPRQMEQQPICSPTQLTSTFNANHFICNAHNSQHTHALLSPDIGTCLNHSSRDLGASLHLSPRLYSPTIGTPVQDNTVLMHTLLDVRPRS